MILLDIVLMLVSSLIQVLGVEGKAAKSEVYGAINCNGASHPDVSSSSTSSCHIVS